MVEHVPRREEQHGNEAECRPQVAILQDRDDVGRRDGEESNGAQDTGRDGDDADPVYWADDAGVGAVGEMAGEPGVDCVGVLGAVWELA